jgi:hypothetical protein
MTDLPEHEERQVRDYVNSQSPEDDQVTLVQKVGTRRILSRVHELYDVHCEQSRWWVISDPMNLYSQEHFPELEVALTFHLGLAIRLADDSRTETDVERERRVSGAWRRFKQAAEAMDSASEAADFQAVGVRCRESLLALVQGQADEPWLGGIEDPPKRSDFKGWGAILAERLGEGRLRAYVNDLVDGTWDLAVWLQHYAEATPSDAELVIDATGHLLVIFGILLRRREQGAPARCPNCGSYAVDEDVEVTEDPEPGFLTSDVCRSCEWRSNRTFTSWDTHFEGADIEGYLNSSTGLSDRLRRRS